MSERTCESCGEVVDALSGVCRNCATAVQSAPGRSSPSVTAVTRPDHQTVGPEIPGYRILETAGEGGMGAVYVAEDTTLGRRVAIKVISTRSSDVQAKTRFLREARTLATIEHPHVVRVYSFGEVGGSPYLAMEYVEGDTLADRIRAAGSIPLDTALRITRDIVDALDAAWERRIVHRDIKPSNILIDRRNRVRVADFGLAKGAHWDSDASLTQSGLMVGTPHYISPEQAQGKEADFRSDFYSLGIMLFHMLTGERPFEGSTPVAIVARHLHEPMPMLRSRRADIPVAVDQLIQWLTQKDPAKRPASHAELLGALDALITRTPTSPLPSFSTLALEPPLSPWRTASIGVAIVAALLAIAATLYVAFGPRRPDAGPFRTVAASAKFVVAVAPFYGPDPDSAKEGRVMAALIERAVAQRLGAQNARVVGIEETKVAVRSHEEARELGSKLAASAVIWGEAFALRRETEIQPHVTLVEEAREATDDASPDSGAETAALLSARRSSTVEALRDTGPAALKLQAEAPNQIELRKTSASGVGDVVVLLAAIHAIEKEGEAEKALRLLREAPRSAETLRYEVQALVKLERIDDARNTLSQALALDPNDAPSQALMGDLLLAADRLPDAVAAYQRAAALGQPYATARAIWFENKLYWKETYRSPRHYDNAETDALFLLAYDPVLQRVVERHPLPGVAESFRVDDGTLVITYNAEMDNRRRPAELRLRGGKFDRPYWPPPNMLWRMRSIRVGRVLPLNFTEELESVRSPRQPGGRFVLSKTPADGFPKSLPELEQALRDAIERDPTQPAHLFFLALTLKHQNRNAEAEALIDELARREWPGIPYFHFAWLMQLTERLELRAWSDELFPRALAKRKEIPQPIAFSVLIERLINAPFSRQAAMNRKPERAYPVLLQARELTGISPEGEDLVGALWVKYFEKRGDHAAAERERAIIRATHAHPFNFLGVTAKADYGLTAAFAAFAAFVVLVVMIFVQAVGRAKREPSVGGSRWLLWLRDRIARIPRLVRVAVSTLVLSGLTLGAILLAFEDALMPVATVLLVIVAAVLFFRLQRIGLHDVAASITRRERRTLLIAYLILLAATAVALDRLAHLQVLSSIPIGLSDGIGHERIVGTLEEMLEDDPNRDALREVLARAKAYAAGTPPAPITPELFQAAIGGGFPDRWEELFRFRFTFDGWLRTLLIATALGLVPLLFFLMFAPRETIAAPPQHRVKRVLMMFVPGAHDIRRERPGRALAILLLAAIPILPLFVLLREESANTVVGLLTATNLPNIAAAIPTPLPPGASLESERLLMMLSYPYAAIFWSVIVLSAIAALVLHVLSVRSLEAPQRLDVVGVGKEIEQVESSEVPAGGG